MKHTYCLPKSGYEIRLTILQMAMDHANSAWQEKNRAAEAEASANAYKQWEKDNPGKSIGPTFAAAWNLAEDKRVEEALATAQKLYGFVESGGINH
jgi:hypothetical protein